VNLSDAARAGIRRVRRPLWDKTAYLRITLTNGHHGPWAQLFSRDEQQVIGAPTPQQVMVVGDATEDYLEYTGERDCSDICQGCRGHAPEASATGDTRATSGNGGEASTEPAIRSRSSHPRAVQRSYRRSDTQPGRSDLHGHFRRFWSAVRALNGVSGFQLLWGGWFVIYFRYGRRERILSSSGPRLLCARVDMPPPIRRK